MDTAFAAAEAKLQVDTALEQQASTEAKAEQSRQQEAQRVQEQYEKVQSETAELEQQTAERDARTKGRAHQRTLGQKDAARNRAAHQAKHKPDFRKHKEAQGRNSPGRNRHNSHSPPHKFAHDDLAPRAGRGEHLLGKTYTTPRATSRLAQKEGSRKPTHADRSTDVAPHETNPMLHEGTAQGTAQGTAPSAAAAAAATTLPRASRSTSCRAARTCSSQTQSRGCPARRPPTTW